MLISSVAAPVVGSLRYRLLPGALKPNNRPRDLPQPVSNHPYPER
jgi:hypothetical protein